MTSKKRFLIPDGYSKESRDEFDRVGMTLAGKLYAGLLMKRMPQAEYDIWYSSDPGVEAPSDEELESYAGVIWPGCNLTIYHDDPRVHNHLRLCERAYEAGVPQFGSCWAIQLATQVAGGTTEPHPKGREMGIANNIRLTEAGVRHPMMKGKPPVFSHFVSHDDYVSHVPDCAEVLAGNYWCDVQAVAVTYKKGVFWATQYHPEYDLNEMACLIHAREERLIKQGWFSDKEDLVNYADKLAQVFREPDNTKNIRWQLKIDDDIVLDDIRECEFVNWLKYAVLRESLV
ncbi:MAG: C26 family cysteine hydrolase domain-containing family [Candidatus Hydrogenedens sp.]|jgi:GMP synthase (glutamine-hydrolysing)|nr:C26 family cysteine hydrolase domain-containing family [Candidatus Hydrogenedens sp.]